MEERKHNFALRLLSIAQSIPGGLSYLKWAFNVPKIETKVFGLTFPTPFGLAAGFDKNGVAVDALSALGFGFVEVGTVTPMEQEGNPKPRISKIAGFDSISNKMGFPNSGAFQVARNLEKQKCDGVVGINIGKGKNTKLSEAHRDYIACIYALHDHADYIVLNVSSPNTEGLTQLQSAKNLDRLLHSVTSYTLAEGIGTPLLLKISPGLLENELDNILNLTYKHNLAGVVATNTLLSDSGGISGKLLRSKADKTIAYISRQTAGTLPIIGIGGVFSADDVLRKMEAGATLVQAYTGFVYNGPLFPRTIIKNLLTKLEQRAKIEKVEVRKSNEVRRSLEY